MNKRIEENTAAKGSERAVDEVLLEQVERASQGDSRAQAALCTRFQPVIFAFALRRLRDAEAAREFVQDVFLILLDALTEQRLQEKERVAGFVLGICRNLSRERAKKGKKRAELLEHYCSALEFQDACKANDLVLSRAKLEDCLSGLTDRSRKVLRGSFYQGLNHQELATELALKPGNIRIIRHRALHALRECIENYSNVYEAI